MWILGESLNGVRRESAAHFSIRDDPTAVGSRNRFPLSSASSVRKKRKKDRASELSPPDRPVRTTLQKPDCSSVAWAVSAHPGSLFKETTSGTALCPKDNI